MLRHLLALPLLAASATAAFGQDDPTCRNGLFPAEEQFALARIGGKDRAYFLNDATGCPAEGDRCRTTAYLVPGDTVIVSRLSDGFACAFYPDAGGGTAGWVDAKRLFLQPLVNRQPIEAWLGEWRSAGNPVLRLSKRVGTLHVSGEAYWPGPPGTHDWPTTHEGAIDGPVKFAGHKGSYADDDMCEVRFTLLGAFLIAADNQQCGGANVSFSGVYTRSK